MFTTALTRRFATSTLRTALRRTHHHTCAAATHVKTRATGVWGTQSYRLHFEDATTNKPLSPWHDIALQQAPTPSHSVGDASPGTSVSPSPRGTATAARTLPLTRHSTLNFVNEIPLGAREKLEIATKEASNPLSQDVKKGKARLFTYGDIPFNYGALPQTWEDPAHVDNDTGAAGDNDPVDVVEISDAPIPVGDVRGVKVLGCFALLDEGETDWKVIAIDAGHRLASQLHGIEDVEKHMPGKLAMVHHWFKYYKTTDGKPENDFAFDGRPQGRDYTLKVIEETHQHWRALVTGNADAGKLSVPAWKSTTATPVAATESTVA
jgi:inorganic pyrophosphatase